jgi:hypothetical protein
MRSDKTVRELPVNKWPLNQAALGWLRRAHKPADSSLPYLAQLLSEGFEANLALAGPGQKFRAELHQASDQLLDWSLDPVAVMRWFTDNPNGPSQPEQSQSLLLELEKAKSWEEAAQNLMEWFYDRKAAQDPYYQLAASHQG